MARQQQTGRCELCGNRASSNPEGNGRHFFGYSYDMYTMPLANPCFVHE